MYSRRIGQLAYRLNFRWGVTRLVWCCGKRAWKIPNPLNGWHNFIIGLNANLCESANWYAFSTTEPDQLEYIGRELLCPVTFTSWGGWLLGMRRVERELTESERDALDLNPWRKLDLHGDDKATNYGWLNGRIVKLDYGHFAFCVRWWNAPYPISV